jgi:hypothetical protein
MTDRLPVRPVVSPQSVQLLVDRRLDRSFGSDMRTEFRRLFTSPRDEVMAVIGNGVAVCAVWLILPQAARESLFALPGQLALAVVLASWMLGDTPATNMLAKDLTATVPLLSDRTGLRRLLRAKAVALACLVGPVCAAVAAAIAVHDGNYAVGGALACTLLVVPFGTAAMAPWLGIVWPYHPRSLRWRWLNRHPRRRLVRWIALVFAPYVFVPALAALVLVPAAAIGIAFGGRDSAGHLTGTTLLVLTVLAALMSLIAFTVGPRVSIWLVAWRQQKLRDYLLDPDRG